MAHRHRIYVWDNLKFLLIVLVVIGHFADRAIQFPSFQSTYLCIYAFHMPLFIFVSGLFHRNENITKKVYTYLCLYLLLKVGYCLVTAWRGKPVFTILTEHEAPWFMFALAVFILLSYLLRDVDAKYVLIFSIIMGCFAGYDRTVGHFLVLSRIFVFFPFYVLGNMLQNKIKDGFAVRKIWKVPAVFILLAWVWVCWYKRDVMYIYRGLFTGCNAFYDGPYLGGCLDRLLCYAVSLITGASVLFLIPHKRIACISKWGSRTLQVYFWHYPIVCAMPFLVPLAAWCRTPFGKISYMLTAIALAVVLSLKIFSLPLLFVKKMQQ